MRLESWIVANEYKFFSLNIYFFSVGVLLVDWLVDSKRHHNVYVRRLPGATNAAKTFPTRTIVNQGNETTRNGEVLLFPPISGDGRW